ncbi:ArsR/SmtB family transcription factor, partial [Burkholderia multivorans]|uniref:ArsR/SmtB family transcription factor n=1 Tax=Burkholderia multivorans TaxID=87883 RepID=UPI001C65A352
ATLAVRHGQCRSGMMGTMPRYVRPDHAALLEAAIEAFGNRVRVHIIGALADLGPSTRKELADHLGVGHSNTVYHHLHGLETLGVVTSDPLPEDRISGQRVRYAVNTDRVAELYDTLGEALRLP